MSEPQSHSTRSQADTARTLGDEDLEGAIETDRSHEEPDVDTREDEETEEITLLTEEDLNDLITEAADTEPGDDPQRLPPEPESGAETPPPEISPDTEPADAHPEHRGPGKAFRPPAGDASTEDPEDPAPTDLRPLVPADVDILTHDEPEGSATAGDVPPLKVADAPRRGRFNRARTMGIAAAVLVLLGIGAGVFFQFETVLGWMTAARVRHPAYPVPVPPSPTTNAPAPVKDLHPARDPGPSDALLPALSVPVARAEELRQKLRAKHAEITQLQGHYQTGLDTVASGLRRRVGSPARVPFAEVSRDRQAVWDLLTVSRRGAYIDQLANIAAQLDAAGAHLQYLERKAAVHSLVHPVARGMDTRKLVQSIETAMEIHASALANLTFQVDPADLPPPAEVWAALADGPADTRESDPDPSAPGAVEPSGTGAHPHPDQAISAEICGGDFRRKHQLTTVSNEAAGCLARWTGKDLILNGVTTLSAEAAAQLTRWQGDWLCLNGLTRITDAAAEHLFRWKGAHLSLNGITALSPDTSRYIPDWRGRQLELAGLTDLSYAVAADLAQWQGNGGTLFVPRQFMGDRP